MGMMPRFGQKLPRLAPGIRRGLLIFLALTYLFVGLAHTVSCADEAIGFAISSDAGNASAGGSHDPDPKKSPLVAESCHVWMPILTTPFFAVVVPSIDPREVALAAPTALLAGYPRLDTPPPKRLI